MEGSRTEQAIRRIEAALNRIEAASDKLAPTSGSDSELAARHEALRGEVAATLRDLDKLIEGLEQ
ncbi:MAG TPA: hypothetical protein VK839_02930 [Erythrobacter sp.]|nr:hypothetical protein [Erythrobacter sp.]